ncbi:hypothetical protein BGX26_012861 [Mortierella sp. AD094]|nr:hypothetical protein BGX26_012861 [Mortierella sp. AD094]
MKLSLFHYFALLACAFAVLCVQVDARTDKNKCLAKGDLKVFCDDTDVQFEKMLDSVFSNAIQKQNGGRRGTTAELRRQSHAKMGIFSDIKDYFVTYWESLKLIFTGNFGEGIFKQLKNAGSWCEKDNWIVKAVKLAINSLSGGALSGICDCLYPIIKSYDNFDKLVGDLDYNHLVGMMDKCPKNMKDQLFGALKKASGKN